MLHCPIVESIGFYLITASQFFVFVYSLGNLNIFVADFEHLN